MSWARWDTDMKTFKRLTYPYIIWITAMIVIPMLLIIVYAFTKQGNDVATLQFTLEHFKKFFTDPEITILNFKCRKQ